MSRSTTSRRAILAGAVTMPIAAATLPALAETGDDAELLRLADEVKAAYDGFGSALDTFEVAETRWLKSNPAPDEESGGLGTNGPSDRGADTTKRTPQRESQAINSPTQSTRSATHAPARFEVCPRKPASAKLILTPWAIF
jgi:hypothetical protein